MRRLSRQWAIVTVAGALGVSVLGVGPAHADRGGGEPEPETVVPLPGHCIGQMTGDQDGSLSITSSPAPGAEVPAGTKINLAATWTRADWQRVEKIVVCVTVDGAKAPDLTGGQRPLDNVGSFSWRVPVPGDLPAGSEICVRDVLFGSSEEGEVTQRSNVICFLSVAASSTGNTTPPPAPVVPEASTAGDPAKPAAEVPAVEVPKVETGDPPVQVASNVLAQAGVAQDETTQSQARPLAVAELPRTGGAPRTLVLLAGIALALGSLALTLGRRRRIRA